MWFRWISMWCVCPLLTGGLRWSVGVWSIRPDVSVWGNKLGSRLCEGEQPRRLHTGHQLQQMDRKENRSPRIHSRSHVSHKMKKLTSQAIHFFKENLCLCVYKCADVSILVAMCKKWQLGIYCRIYMFSEIYFILLSVWYFIFVFEPFLGIQILIQYILCNLI